MKNNILFIITAALVILAASILYLANYKTSYLEVDIADKLRLVESNLSDNQELIVFNSKNPFNFNDLLFRYKYLTNQKVYAVLTFPDSPNPKYSAVIGVAGSKGWSDHHYGYMQRYLDAGFATVTLHSFDSRDVSSTVGEQVSATTAMLVNDAYKTLKQLSNHPRIDKNNIGITGWSLGGAVALFTAWKPLKNKISPNHQFKAHLPIYPPCMVMPESLHFTDVPIHILIGEDDDWVPADACIDMVNSINMPNVSITTYPDSHHSFDRFHGLLKVQDSYSFTDCRLKLTDDGIVRSLNAGIPLSNSIMQKAVLAFCAERGTTYGGNKEAREHSSQFALEFMDNHLRSQ